MTSMKEGYMIFWELTQREITVLGSERELPGETRYID